MNRSKLSITDPWALAQNFLRGDVVSRYNGLSGTSEDIVGVVTSVHPGIGFVNVEFPWGNERVSADELMKVNPSFSYYVPSQVDTSYSAWDISQAHREDGSEIDYSYARPRRASNETIVQKLAADWDTKQRDLLVATQQCKYSGLDEIDALTTIGKTGRYPDHQIRTAINKVYKTGLYWSGPGRQYRMNLGEIDDGLPNCPKCKTNLQKSNYKKHTKLFVCPVCLFCIKPSDIEGLPGYVEESGFGVGDEGQDLLTAAIRSAANDIKTAKWDELKKQARNWVNKNYPKARRYADMAAVALVQESAGRLNVHEESLPKKELAAKMEKILASIADYTAKEWARDLIRSHTRKGEFSYPDEAVDSLTGYILDVPASEKINTVLGDDKREAKRLLRLHLEMDQDRATRYSVGFQRILASHNSKPVDVRRAVGTDTLQEIYDIVRSGTESLTISEEFDHDFGKYGFGDAMFLLGARTADGLFDRTAYNRLVDILTRQEGG